MTQGRCCTLRTFQISVPIPSRPLERDIRIHLERGIWRRLELKQILDLEPARTKQPDHVAVPEAKLDGVDDALIVPLEAMHPGSSRDGAASRRALRRRPSGSRASRAESPSRTRGVHRDVGSGGPCIHRYGSHQIAAPYWRSRRPEVHQRTAHARRLRHERKCRSNSCWNVRAVASCLDELSRPIIRAPGASATPRRRQSMAPELDRFQLGYIWQQMDLSDSRFPHPQTVPPKPTLLVLVRPSSGHPHPTSPGSRERGHRTCAHHTPGENLFLLTYMSAPPSRSRT